MEAPKRTTGAPAADLLELVQELRRALAQRDEAPAGEWVEQTADDLRTGRKTGWYYPPGPSGGVAFFASRGPDAYGHVHASVGEGAQDRGLRLSEALLDGLPSEVRSVDVGFTGLGPDDERGLLARLAQRAGSVVIDRLALERPLSPSDREDPGPPPAGLALVPVRDVTPEALAELDRRAFAGTVDELLIGRSPADYLRVVRALLDGSLGRFLDEASIALVVEEPLALAGALLSGEQSARRAIFLEFLVDPDHRRQGYGRFLLRWGFRALLALGYGSVRLWVTAANEAARALYESEGFRPVRTATIYRWERPSDAPQPQTVP